MAAAVREKLQQSENCCLAKQQSSLLQHNRNTKELNSNENLSDSNIIKFFYLNITRSVNVSEVSYISSFRSEAELKQRFQYQFNFSPSSTQRVEVSLLFIVYEYEYIKAEAYDIL